MPHHDWSDKSFDWDSLHKAINYITTTWKTYARIGNHSKEKWGCLRDHPYFWDGGIHSLIYPGYVYIQNRFLYYTVDTYLTKPFTKYTGIHYLGLKWQALVYNYAIQKACKAFPHIIDELVSNLDGYELVKPGIFGYVCGKTIHKKYWKSHE